MKELGNIRTTTKLLVIQKPSVSQKSNILKKRNITKYIGFFQNIEKLQYIRFLQNTYWKNFIIYSHVTLTRFHTFLISFN